MRSRTCCAPSTTARPFLLKNCAPDELIHAVGAAHDGDAYLSPPVARLVLGMIAPVEAGRRQQAVERPAALTARESQVLRLVAEGLSNAGIGRRLHTSETTVKTCVSRVLARLGCSNRVQAALLARDAGPRHLSGTDPHGTAIGPEAPAAARGVLV